MKQTKKLFVVLLAFALVLLLGVCAAAETGDAPAATVVETGECGAEGSDVQYTLYSDGTLYIDGEGAIADYGYVETGDGNGEWLCTPWEEARDYYENRELLDALGYESYAALETAMQNGTLDGEAYYEVIMQYGYEMLTKWSNLQKKVVIGEGVTGIGERAFAGWEATELSLPSTLKTIGKGAFTHGKYTEIALPEGLLEIGDEAFSSVPLREITIPASVQTISDSAFSACADLEKITVLNDRFDVSALMLYAYVSEKEIPFASHADYNAFLKLSYQFDYLALLHSAAYFVSEMRGPFPWWTPEQRTAFEEMQLIAGIRVELGYDTTSADECAAALAADINATLGTDFTVGEILGTPIATYRCSDALMDAVNAYDDATGDPYVSEIGHYTDTYFAQAVTHLNCRDTFLANEMVKGLTADEAAARYDERAAELLGILNEKLDPDAADLASAVPQALAMINAALGTDFTLETAGAFVDYYNAPSAALVDAIVARFNPAVSYLELENFALHICPAGTDGYTVVPWLTLSGGCTAAVKDFAETAGIPYEPIHWWNDWEWKMIPMQGRPGEKIRSCYYCQTLDTMEVPFTDAWDYEWVPLPTSPDGLEEGDYYLDFSNFFEAAELNNEALAIYNSGEFAFVPDQLLFWEKITLPAALSESGEDEVHELADFVENDGFEFMAYSLRQVGEQWLPVSKTTEGLQTGDWYVDLSAADAETRARLSESEIFYNPNGDLLKYKVIIPDLQESNLGMFFPLMTNWANLYGDWSGKESYTPDPYYSWPEVCPVRQYIAPEDTNWIDLPFTTDGLSDGDWYLDIDAFMDLVGRGKSDEEKAEVRALIEQHVVFSYNPGGEQYVYKYEFTDLPAEDGTPVSGTVILPLDLTLGSDDAFPYDYNALQQCVRQYHTPTAPDTPQQPADDDDDGGNWFDQHIIRPLRSAIATILSFFRRLFGKKR